jgi:hypothetical protein
LRSRNLNSLVGEEGRNAISSSDVVHRLLWKRSLGLGKGALLVDLVSGQRLERVVWICPC